MKIEHEFEYNARHTEIAAEFCGHDSEYQAEAINSIGSQFDIWAHDDTRTYTFIQILEIAEQLNDKGRWFIETLCDYMKDTAEREGQRMTAEEQIKQAILGFTEFFKGITGNQNLEIPSEIAEKYGIQTQANVLDQIRAESEKEDKE